MIGCIWGGAAPVSARSLSMPEVVQDTVPPAAPPKNPSWLRRNLQQWSNRHYRDSVLDKLSRQNEPTPEADTSMRKSEQEYITFLKRNKIAGKNIIRNIYCRKLQVFGPSDIYDTSFSSSMKLLRLANNLHYDSREWVIRQSLFFHTGDTVNVYELADNERYLRNLPFIQDARIYITLVSSTSDSVDINVITKDVFEYGGALGELSPTSVQFNIYNNDLFGAGQALNFGFLWNELYSPEVGTQLQYTKSNIGGSFIDGTVGYTYLNNNNSLDTNNYEGSYYINLNRPLFRSVTTFIGGISLANNFAINVHSLSDSLFRNYKYDIVDGWLGYNFRPKQKRNGEMAKGPNVGFLARHYNLYFTQPPAPYIYKTDPSYNNRRYMLGEVAVYKQDFFKAHYFFGFGRTEDIPLGYNIGIYGGAETWDQRQRSYSAINLQKYWVTPQKGLLNTTFGISSFWHQGTGSEDAVIHGEVDYYSRLFTFKHGRLRQFFTADYLDCPNSYFYKPLDLNGNDGIYGFNRVYANGYQRLNVRALTTLYSQIKIYGFKFNFLGSIQTSKLAARNQDLMDSPLYAGFGLGCDIRNENLTFNTLRIDGNYYPFAPPQMRHNWFFEITTITDFKFNIFALTAPSYLSFK